MRQRYFTFLMLVIVLFACNKTDKYLYPNDPRLSDANGFPTDTSRAILPFSIKYNGKVNQLFLDSSQITEYNKRLNFARCPLLYNYYLNKEIYRFSAFCSIRGSAIFTIYHDHSGYFTNFKVTWDYKECVLSTEVNEHFKCLNINS